MAAATLDISQEFDPSNDNDVKPDWNYRLHSNDQ